MKLLKDIIEFWKANFKRARIDQRYWFVIVLLALMLITVSIMVYRFATQATLDTPVNYGEIISGIGLFLTTVLLAITLQTTWGECQVYDDFDMFVKCFSLMVEEIQISNKAYSFKALLWFPVYLLNKEMIKYGERIHGFLTNIDERKCIDFQLVCPDNIIDSFDKVVATYLDNKSWKKTFNHVCSNCDNNKGEITCKEYKNEGGECRLNQYLKQKWGEIQNNIRIAFLQNKRKSNDNHEEPIKEFNNLHETMFQIVVTENAALMVSHAVKNGHKCVVIYTKNYHKIKTIKEILEKSIKILNEKNKELATLAE